MFLSHMFYGGHGLDSFIVDAVIRSVIYHLVGDALRAHGMSGLMVIGVILIVIAVAIVLFRLVGSLANSVGRSVRGGGRY